MSDAEKDDLKHGRKPSAGRSAHASGAHEPGWANGLRRLYDAVVEEPLPDSFKDLLSRLDDGHR